MTLTEIISKITAEKSTPGRFPARLIFVRNFADYTRLVDKLRTECDVTLDLAAYTESDLLPSFSKLWKEIAKHDDKLQLLLSFGEYLRLCIKRELDTESREFPSFWANMQAESSKTKYLIPLFSCRELFDQIVPNVDERQTAFIWEFEETKIESEFSITVYASPEFNESVKADAIGLKAWLENWTTFYGENNRNKFSLITRQWKYANISLGNIKIEIVSEPFGYVYSLVTDGEKLRAEYGSAELWAEVAKNVNRHEPFAATIKRVLNAGENFDPIPILAQWDSLSATKRKLFLMWYKLYPTADYASVIIGKVATTDEIPLALRDGVFELPNISPAFAKERTLALNALNLSYSDDYFAKLDSVTSYETRLSLLTYKTHKERAYAIKTVCGLLRKDEDVTAIVDALQKAYPDLAVYLTEHGNDDISRYFNWYRKSKIINRPTTDMPYAIDFDAIDSRNKVINTIGNKAAVFWVDGLGIEWLPLLVGKLQTLPVGVTVDEKIGLASLPTETEYNHRWKDTDEKWDRLDKLAHKGMPDDKDYFSCVARQLEIIGEIVEHIDELLKTNDSVLLTGDHGSSRLAALLFHDADNFAVTPPKGAVVRSFGRFCELPDSGDIPITPSMEIVITHNHMKQQDVKCVVMKSYEHFKKSGNAAGGNTDDNAVAGEIHGGMSPEEYLVPVIIVSRKNTLPKPTEPTKPKGIGKNDMGI